MRWLFDMAWRRVTRCFVAGVLAILPLVITVAVVLWVGRFLHQLVGPGTLLGEAVRRLGLSVAADETLAYVIGAVLVVAAVFGVGVAVEAGARSLLQRLLDALLIRLPVIGSLYGTSKQVVSLFDQRDDAKLKAMKAVFCVFGKESGCGVLALLVSPERYRIQGRDYQIVIVPTAPVPIGGGLLFVPAEVVQPVDLSVEALMSIYVSMGVTIGQYVPPSETKPPGLPAT
jgi:uncharacterized membrane protein